MHTNKNVERARTVLQQQFAAYHAAIRAGRPSAELLRLQANVGVASQAFNAALWTSR